MVHRQHFWKHLLILAATGTGLVVAALVLTAGWNRPAIGKPPATKEPSGTSKFMRAKLTASQSVLEGLVTEDYTKITAGARKMIVMSKATEWQVIKGPEYAQYSAEFRRSCEQLIRMAKKKNMDGSALSYMHLTMTCIGCHKFVRGVKIAAGEPVPNGLRRANASLFVAQHSIAIPSENE